MSTQTRVLSVSLSEEVAAQIEALAQKEHRTVSDLFYEAFRNYRAQRMQQTFERLDRTGTNTNPFGYAEDDVERLVEEAREELETERKPKRDAVRTRQI